MPMFIATSPFGLRDLVEEEVIACGGKVKKREDRAIYFEGNWRTCYLMNYTSNFASRILYSILDFDVYNEDELYEKIKKHDYTKYISPDQAIKVRAKVYHSKTFNDQRFVAMKVKDAIVDQFYEKCDARPDVDIEDPDLCVHIRIVKTKASVAIDTSGEALHERGYRRDQGAAPLKENIAAAMVRMSAWKKEEVLIDPMCGSGTILIEAARMACKIPNGASRDFTFERWKNFQKEVFSDLRKEVDAKQIKGDDLKIYGSDISGQMIQMAKRNAKRAGVDEYIHWQVMDIESFDPSFESAKVITNPPYAERLSSEEEARSIYESMGKVFFRKKNWELWVLSGNSELTKSIRMKASQKIPLRNGNLECRLLHYPIY